MLPKHGLWLTNSLALLFIACLLSLFGCRSVVADTPSELRLNLGVEPATLDPALATDPGSQQIARMIFSSLVDIDAASGAPQHALATAWSVSTDGLIWEFKLRSDAIWVRYIPSSDKIESRRAVNASDIVYSVQRIFDPRVGSGFGPLLAPLIRGAASLRAANIQNTSDADWQNLLQNLGVQALDDNTVRFTLTRPASYFPSLVSTWLVRTQPRESVDAGGSVWTEPGNLWTDGPFVLQSWSHNREIILQKNPYWYDAANVRIDHIRLEMIADTASALAQYRNGSLDSLDPYGALTPADYDLLKDDPVFSSQLHVVLSQCAHYYGFNTTKPPFNEVLVRKAFVAAIDRDTLVSSVVKLGEPARWFTHPDVVASLDISDTLGIPFNANQARDFLRQAGYDKKRLPAITLAVNTDDIHERVADAVVQMWKNNLGAEVATKTYDWKGYQQTLHDDPPQIFRLGWCAYYPDAAGFGTVFHSGSPDNFTRWSSPAYDQAIDSGSRQVDLTSRRASYRAAEKVLTEDAAVIAPLWWSTRLALTRPNVQRTYAITDGYERFDTWSLR
jgi:ABC-type oligopeptide transport system substrate-binding subunit